ncbi:MAG: phosphoadenylyl-sulfate reductase [Thermodesulfobacteriota bacterium]
MKLKDITEKKIAELNAMDAEALIKWAFTNFGERAAIGTSFQLSGSVIVDMAARHFDKFRVFTVDTLRLHPEIYDAIGAAEKKHGIRIERFYPDEGLLKDMTERFGEYLFFIDKAKQEYCCNVRKVEPNRRALATLDVWITGLRRDQSGYRKDVEKASFVEEGGRRILKLCPLADWDLDRVWKYIKEKNVPYNRLFDKGYDSIGCIICSTPLVKGESPRSGRWRWFNKEFSDDKKECGIHIPNPKGGSKK